MSAVDVLAVMNDCRNDLDAARMGVAAKELAKARAAVAELIEAAQEVIDGTVNAVTYPDGPCIERKDRQRLIDALALVGGAA